MLAIARTAEINQGLDPMRTDWRRRLGALERKFLPVPDGLPAVVYGLREDGKRCFLWAGWQHDGKRKEWNRSSGEDLPEDLKQLIRKYDLPRPV